MGRAVNPKSSGNELPYNIFSIHTVQANKNGTEKYLCKNEENDTQLPVITSFIARGSYHSGPNPAAFLASTLKGGFNGPRKCLLTTIWNF